MCVAQKIERSAESKADADAADASQGKPLRTWAGRGGQGSRCEVCRQPIEAAQVEYELELETHGRVWTVKLHVDCYEQWMLLHEAT
jgi:hypothetical protein